MITRAELKAEMYEYSQKIKQILATPQAYIEKIFGNDSPKETQTEQKIHRFEHRLDIRSKTKTGEKTEDTRFPMEKFADRLGSEGLYAKIFRNRGEVTLQDLMEQGGVKSEDIKTILDGNAEKLSQILPGKTNHKLAEVADTIQGKPNGKCLYGVQMMIHNAQIGVTIPKTNPDWPDKEKYAGNSNSACNTYIPLEKSGEFITVDVPNKAHYVGRRNPLEYQKANEEMQQFNRNLPAGTIACVDNNSQIRGRRLTSSDIHGHVWVQDNRHQSKCDGAQPQGPDFRRYGPKIHISVPKDCIITKELAIEILCQARLREHQQKHAPQYEWMQNKVACR